MSDTATKKEPFISVLSPKVKVLYGFKDGHAEVLVVTPIKDFHVPVPVEKIEGVRKLFTRFYGWALKTDEERKDGKGDVEEVLDERCKARGEYPDGHVELCVRPISLSPWIPVTLSKEELIHGKKTMDEVYGWLQLPEEVRNFQGV